MIRGRHSSKFEVDTDTRTVEDDASVPDASILEAGVVRLNLANSRESLAALYLPCTWAVMGNSRRAGRGGGIASKSKPTSTFPGDPFQSASRLPAATPAGAKPLNRWAGTSRLRAASPTETSRKCNRTTPACTPDSLGFSSFLLRGLAAEITATSSDRAFAFLGKGTL